MAKARVRMPVLVWLLVRVQVSPGPLVQTAEHPVRLLA